MKKLLVAFPLLLTAKLASHNYPKCSNFSTINIYNILEELSVGTPMISGNRENNFGQRVARGIYPYPLRVGNRQFVGKMNQIK